MNLSYKAEFIFSKEVSEVNKRILVGEFFRLRNQACDRLNDNYENWNKEFGNVVITENNETEYYDFIREKQQPILDEVNKHGRFINLESGEDCDIISRSKKDKELTIQLALIPCKHSW